MVTATSSTAERRGDVFDPACPTRQLLDRVSGKWVVMIVKLLADVAPSDLRFTQLERAMPGVSHKMLSQTLQALSRDRLIARRVEPTVPPQVFYGLTELGLSLAGPLAALRQWAEEHMADVDPHLQAK